MPKPPKVRFQHQVDRVDATWITSVYSLCSTWLSSGDMAVVFACICHMFKYRIVCVLQYIVHLSNWYFPNFLLISLLTLCWAISKFDISHNPVQTTTFFHSQRRLVINIALHWQRKKDTKKRIPLLYCSTLLEKSKYASALTVFSFFFFFSFFLLAHIFLNRILQNHRNLQQFHRKMNPSELDVLYRTTWCSCMVMESHWTLSVWISVYIFFQMTSSKLQIICINKTTSTHSSVMFTSWSCCSYFCLACVYIAIV